MPASVECKHYRWIDLQCFWTKTGPVFKWIDQAVKASGKYAPIVVFKWNLSKIYCIYPVDKFYLGKTVALRFRYRKRDWSVVLFSSFLRWTFDEELEGDHAR